MLYVTYRQGVRFGRRTPSIKKALERGPDDVRIYGTSQVVWQAGVFLPPPCQPLRPAPAPTQVHPRICKPCANTY